MWATMKLLFYLYPWQPVDPTTLHYIIILTCVYFIVSSLAYPQVYEGIPLVAAWQATSYATKAVKE